MISVFGFSDNVIYLGIFRLTNIGIALSITGIGPPGLGDMFSAGERKGMV